MSETFRPARPEEVPEVARLVIHSFPGPERPPGWWRDELESPPYGGGVETLWVGEAGGRVIAACQLHSLHQWVGGVRISTMGLGTVAISPAHRRRGVAARLVASGLRHARERGDVASALFPFRVSFYERLGYGLAGEALQYRVPPEVLPDAPERSRVDLAETDAERAEVRELYRRWITTQNGQVERTERQWRSVFGGDDRATALYRGESGEVEGYAVVRYRPDLPPQDRFLEVEERAWTTPAARRGLYAWLGSLGDQWPQILYRAHPGERFADRVREPRLPFGGASHWNLWFPAATLLYGPMFRLLDLRAAWEARNVRGDAALTLGLEVTDEQFPESAGAWRLRIEDGRIGVERGDGAVDASLRLGISTLSRIFVGALSPSAAVEAGLADTDRPAALQALDDALRLPSPWTFERF